MDPYLEDEALWPEFHSRLLTTLLEDLGSAAVDRYRVLFGKRSDPVAASLHGKDYLEIRERYDGRLVTLVDVPSPAIKTTAAGRQAYLEQRQKAREAGANLVEIDLVLQGQPTLDYSRDGLPDWDYAVTVTRSTQPERYEIYTTTLRKRLPRFRVPVAAGDRDMVLDLQAAFTRCYERGRFSERIDYRREPAHNQIARVAYAIWKQEGQPHGRDREHWYGALARFRPVKA
jgi:hypothetical protein